MQSLPGEALFTLEPSSKMIFVALLQLRSCCIPLTQVVVDGRFANWKAVDGYVKVA